MSARRLMRPVLGLLLLALAMFTAGCSSLGLSSLEWANWEEMTAMPWDEDKDEPQTARDLLDELETKVDTPMIGEYTSISGLNAIILQGVGLVVNLDGTGEDPPPSSFRRTLIDEMNRRDIPGPNEILRSPNTALVVVRGFLSPLVREGDTFDIEVRLPPNSEATSLAGGTLLATYLYEAQVAPTGQLLQGHEMGTAEGPILISTGIGGDANDLAGVLRRGRVVGGGKSKIDRNLSMFLRNEYRSIRNSRRVADRIGKRFHSYDDHGLREPLAEAKTDQKIEVKIHPEYADNYPRYLQVIRNIAFRESEVARRVRMRRLEDQLNEPATAERAALQLEALGQPGLPILQRALKSKDLEVRFHAGMSLAYLGEPDGLESLAEAAREEPAFRVFALAAMAASKEAEANMLLRSLLSESSAETRYGAFRSLTVLDENDPFVRGETMEGGYKLHALDVEGPPLVHLTHKQRTEVVIFGADQKLQLPIAARAGNHIIVSAPPGSDTVSVSRYQVGQPDKKETVPATLADVIRACDKLGANYPDIAAFLVQAHHQNNLAGAIAIDELPEAGRVYYRNGGGDTIGGRSVEARVGSGGLTPNLFRAIGEEDSENNDPVKDDSIYLPDTKSDDKKEKSRDQMTKSKSMPLDEDIEDDSDSMEPKKLAQAEEFEDFNDEPPSQSSGKSWLTMPAMPQLPSFNFGGVPEQYEPEVE
ncbi:flagellar basal body P-ring protein FlgI [Calycomorphotria hydatis]|uniref:Flagellar basal body P-ring protein n=1 Tax=Calycomorphotria hydatis TaxID=2528027 RepID=A0A517T425_9PLAN|nr:flagellar basal body P-ring protein FlgI [Calycomorphotria hydatis]QDT63125.1 flagellar basal body P-ring protein [Calycomorphotria hydatis]